MKIQKASQCGKMCNLIITPLKIYSHLKNNIETPMVGMHYYHAQCCFEKNYVIDPTSQIDFSQL
jgi:hypothetical protein